MKLEYLISKASYPLGSHVKTIELSDAIMRGGGSGGGKVMSVEDSGPGSPMPTEFRNRNRKVYWVFAVSPVNSTDCHVVGADGAGVAPSRPGAGICVPNIEGTLELRVHSASPTGFASMTKSVMTAKSNTQNR